MPIYIGSHEFPLRCLETTIHEHAGGLAVHLQNRHVGLAIIDSLVSLNVIQPSHIVNEFSVPNEQHLAVFHPGTCSGSLGHKGALSFGLELHHHREITIKSEHLRGILRISQNRIGSRRTLWR